MSEPEWRDAIDLNAQVFRALGCSQCIYRHGNLDGGYACEHGMPIYGSQAICSLYVGRVPPERQRLVHDCRLFKQVFNRDPMEKPP